LRDSQAAETAGRNPRFLIFSFKALKVTIYSVKGKPFIRLKVLIL
jgi:hypothetical protein